MSQIVSYYQVGVGNRIYVKGKLISGQWQDVQIQDHKKASRFIERNLSGERLEYAVRVLDEAKADGKKPMHTYIQGGEDAILQSILTPAECAELFGIKEDTVRWHCESAAAKGETWCRKSGKTWLIRRDFAEIKWKTITS